MKAAVYEGLDQITYREVPTPEPDQDGVLVKVHACAVCGSDIRIFHHGNNRVSPPQILGHEIAGEVVRCGKNVTKFSVGDRVAIGADVPCGACVFCEAGIGNNCQINYAMGYQFAGGFAEYVLLNRTVVQFGPVHKIPDHVSYPEAALAEPLACAINALSLSPVRLNDTVVMIGAGPIGMMLCQLAKLCGAAKVILINRSRPRLALAQKLAVADRYVCSAEEDAVAYVKAETNGLGADVILTACPSPEAQAEALEMAKNRARINFFGGLPKGGSQVTLDTNLIHYKELLVTGSHGSTPAQHAEAVDLISAGRFPIRQFATHEFPLSEIHDAFSTAETHSGLRVIVRP